MKFIFSILILTFTSLVFSQSKVVTFAIDFNPSTKQCIPCDFDKINQSVITIQNKNLHLKGNYNFTYEIINTQYTTIILPLNVSLQNLPKSINPQINFGKSILDNYILFNSNAVINENGSPKLLSKITVRVDYTPKNILQTKGASFANESVLKKGKWYKFSVNKSGVYKIDKTLLESSGISTTSLNPQHINVYANHTPKLPESNAAYHPDDLLKNAIFIQGESDGTFDESDYILLYATGPNIETIDTLNNRFEVLTNNSDLNNYFYLHIDASDPPKRLSTSNSSSLSSTHNLTTCNDYVLHEEEDTNLVKSGTSWLGEFFDIELSKTINFDLKGINSSAPVNIYTRAFARKKTGNCNFSVLYNGNSILNIPINNNVNSYYTIGYFNTLETDFYVNQNNINLTVEFNKGGVSQTIGWLDRILLNYKRNISVSNGQMICRDIASIGSGNVVTYNVSGASNNTNVWEVTDPSNVTKINTLLSGSTAVYTKTADSLRTFAIFNNDQAYTPNYVKSIGNQNLHGLGFADYLIVSHVDFLSQANRLADLHRANGLSVHVVEVEQVYNEFSGGVKDLVAIRWFVKMFYDRAAGDILKMPKSLLLFGDGSYDERNIKGDNQAKIPTYRSNSEYNSNLNLTGPYTSDDFYGILDDNESFTYIDLIDIGVGRFCVNTLEEATNSVNKVEHYMKNGSNYYSTQTCDNEESSSTFGDWKTKTVLIADDQNNNQFVSDCESVANTVYNSHNEMNVIKIYLDAYQQMVTSGGQRYPSVERAINEYISKGALVFNYIGHGGETGLAAERIIDLNMINNWKNINRLPVFVSATCEFSRYDDPDRVSAGEQMFLNKNGGAIALLTTTRPVFVSTNTIINNNLYTVIFDEVNGEALTLGEIMRQTKNLTASSSPSSSMRIFTLLGDPALKLTKPKPNIVLDSLNGTSVLSAIDTLKALSKIKISGHIEDYLGNTLNNYNGVLTPNVLDKAKTYSTLGQDSDSYPQEFTMQNNTLYRGKITIKNGYFSFEFIVPKDINYAYGKGKLSFYANNGNEDHMGADTSFIVGGVDPNGINDNIPPTIDIYLNDENFANGGLTDRNPLLIAKITDENGINTSGNGIGHDITVILDENTADPIILNNFYEADLDTYKSGQIKYQFYDLEEGPHKLTLKVWDVNNNSAEETVEFVVSKTEDLTISHLLNYPNPFTTHTEFFFEHNQLHNLTEVRVDIFTISGKLVKTIFADVNSCAYRSEGIPWNGLDEYGDKLARGVYIYRLTVKNSSGQKVDKIEKLYIL
jgi:hypothetical protein